MIEQRTTEEIIVDAFNNTHKFKGLWWVRKEELKERLRVKMDSHESDDAYEVLEELLDEVR